MDESEALEVPFLLSDSFLPSKHSCIDISPCISLCKPPWSTGVEAGQRANVRGDFPRLWAALECGCLSVSDGNNRI